MQCFHSRRRSPFLFRPTCHHVFLSSWSRVFSHKFFGQMRLIVWSLLSSSLMWVRQLLGLGLFYGGIESDLRQHQYRTTVPIACDSPAFLQHRSPISGISSSWRRVCLLLRAFPPWETTAGRGQQSESICWIWSPVSIQFNVVSARIPTWRRCASSYCRRCREKKNLRVHPIINSRIHVTWLKVGCATFWTRWVTVESFRSWWIIILRSENQWSH